MSLKCGLAEVKTHLCRTFTMTMDRKSFQQRVVTRYFTHQRTFKSVEQRNRTLACSRNLPFIAKSQRNLHSVNSKRETRTVISEVEHDGHELSIIEPAVPHEEIMLHLRDCKTVTEQMTMLHSLLRLTDEDIKERMSICNDVRNMLQPFFEDFRLQLYGSSVNGFGFKGCDIDMSFNAIVNPEDVMSELYDESSIPLFKDVLSGKVSPKYISRLPSMNQLFFIHSVFLNYYTDSTVPPRLIKAYRPIINFMHDKYNLNCDLSCKNMSALKNTKLLSLYGKIDERVMQLMIAIRYWAKHVQLIGRKCRINTYTISLMLIYYLQTRTPPVLPSAEYIFSVADSVMSHDMHDEDIFKDIKKIPPSKNTESVEDLFQGFFSYYLYFDFTRVICPLNASDLPREEFHAVETNKKFRMNAICIQDPTNLKHNVASLIHYEGCRRLALQMLMACKHLQDSTFWSPQDGDWGLLRIMHQEKKYDSNDEAFLNFEIPLHLSDSERKQDVLQQVSYLVLKILKEALLFEYDMIQKTEEADFNNDNLLFSIKCKTLYNTWLGRNCTKPDENLINVLEKERSVSLKLCNRKKEKKHKIFNFYCRGYVVDKNNQLSLHVKVAPFEETTFSLTLGSFLKEYIPRTVRSLL